MRRSHWLLATAASLLTLAGALAQDPVSRPAGQADQQGVEVQVRGTVHEAFAQPSTQIQAEFKIISKQPPEPINELPPDQKPEGDNVLWVPGYWFYEEDRQDFLWVSGIWRNFPPDHEWVPGYWVEDDGGWRWISGYWSNIDIKDVDLLPQPPKLVEENVPPARDDGSTWIPGTWVYHDTEYRWRPGYWVTYKPGWVWMPAKYYWTPSGYIFRDGFWDFDIERRGLIFAPVTFTANVYTQPNFVYRPHYVIGVDFLRSSLFVNAHYHHYYFGDYYAYGNRGYVPWINYRHGHFHDPLYSYYRWRYRDDRMWIQNLERNYTARRDTRDGRPIRTLADLQRGNVDQSFKNAVVTVNNVTQVNKNIRMTNVQRDSNRDVSQRFRTIATERQRNEARNANRTTRDRDATGRDATGRDATGRDTRRDATGRDATGRDATGRDATGRDATGRDATGRDTRRDATGRDATGRDTRRDATGRDATGRDTRRDATGRDTTPPGKGEAAGRTTPPPRDTTPPTRGDATGRTAPPTRETTPPTRETTPPARDTTPPRREAARDTTPINRGEASRPSGGARGEASRYQRTRTEQNLKRGTGDNAPPPRPQQAQPQRKDSREPQKDRTPPAKDRDR